jgi:hypothetical protein
MSVIPVKKSISAASIFQFLSGIAQISESHKKNRP